jgi:hypothetical protein
MADKKKYDMNSPEAKAVIDEIVHGTFMTEGTMVAFPLCFPGASTPIPPDESLITALDITPEGIVYGGTSGRVAHLFVGMFHGVTGVVFDLGAIEGMTECTSVCCCHGKVIAVGKGPKGGLLVSTDYQGLPFDLIQEWGFSRPPIKTVMDFPKEEGTLATVVGAEGKTLVCQAVGRLLSLDVESQSLTEIGSVPDSGCLLQGGPDGIFGFDQKRTLWRYIPSTKTLERRIIPLPEGCQVGDSMQWARGQVGGISYLADDAGALFPFTGEKGFGAEIGRARLAPVGAMAVTHDGRLIGACGDGIGRLFVYSPREGRVKDIGVALSVLERRRYGYQFGGAVTGRDGEIYFGEKDQGGHLWIYFPRIEKSIV